MITKDRLNELALEVAPPYMPHDAAFNFAHALIKRIEKEAKVVGYKCSEGSLWAEKPEPTDTKLIALPLIGD